MGQRLIISEEERSRISGMYGLVNEQNNTETIFQMLEGKEFPDLTKQVEGDTILYSLIDPVTKKRRLWWISFRITGNNQVETEIAASDPKYFKLIKKMFDSLRGFREVGWVEGFDNDPEYPGGVKKTKVDKEEVNEIFDTLVKSYNANKNTIPEQ